MCKPIFTLNSEANWNTFEPTVLSGIFHVEALVFLGSRGLVPTRAGPALKYTLTYKRQGSKV